MIITKHCLKKRRRRGNGNIMEGVNFFNCAKVSYGSCRAFYILGRKRKNGVENNNHPLVLMRSLFLFG
jgi:hypothetical protein